MPISRPATKTKISTTEWGFPITDEVNRLTAAVLALTPTAWVTVPTFTNGWVNVPSWQVTQYRKIGDNVQVRGYIQSGSANQPAFTLPVGFRPPTTLTLTSNTYVNAARVIQMVQVWSTGAVQPENTGATDLSFIFSTI